LLLLFNTKKEDLFETFEKKAGEEKKISEKTEK